MSWVEPRADGHALVYSRRLGAEWQPPVTVAEGPGWFVNWADVPSVKALSADFWAAHWLVEQPGGMYAYDIHLALSRDGGITWDAPFVPHDDATPTEHGFVSLWSARLPGGGTGLGAVWLDGRETLLDPADTAGPSDPRTMLRSAVFDMHGGERSSAVVDERVCDCCQTDVAQTERGPLVVYRDRTAGEIRDVRASVADSSGWQSLEAPGRDGWLIEGCPVNGPAVATLAGSTMVGWYTEAGGDRRVQAAFLSRDASWSPARAVDDSEPLGRVDVDVLENGDGVVSWLSTTPEGRAWILLSRVGADGTPGRPLRVARTEASRPAGFPQLLAQGDSLLVAWTRWRDDVPRVVVSTVPVAALAAP